MAVIRKKEQSDGLLDSSVKGKEYGKIEIVKPLEGSKKDDKQPPKKKKGFLKSTKDELKKVDWPGFKYVVSWGAVVVLFATGLALFLGLFDHVFSSGMKYVDCTATMEETDISAKKCSQNLIDDLTFQDDEQSDDTGAQEEQPAEDTELTGEDVTVDFEDFDEEGEEEQGKEGLVVEETNTEEQETTNE